MAVALRGVQRATFDLDFLLLLNDLPSADAALTADGYICVFKNNNVSHYQKSGGLLARVDILHAFRGHSLSMLDRADRMPFGSGCTVPVARIEDIIGLKIQALCNDPTRAPGDWSDVYALLVHASSERIPLDWELIGDYLSIFGLNGKLDELRRLGNETI